MSQSLIGQVINKRYKVEAYIASGGMKTVYKVQDLNRSVPLAMKMLHADLEEDPAVLRSFERETRAIKKLAHPNIVRFYGLEKSGNSFFMLEQFIDGPSLKDILKEYGTLQVKEALIYFKALCAALGFAHANGVIHCDVKPGNVLIDQGGNILLTDFGIARHSGSDSTSTFAGAGTPAYMAPEQILGNPVSPETDIYALGVVLFEMLTGQRPFRGTEPGLETAGNTQNERIKYAHLRLTPPSPRSFNSCLPEKLADAILTALSKNAEDRYHDTQIFFKEICAAVGITVDEVPALAAISRPVGNIGSGKRNGAESPVPSSLIWPALLRQYGAYMILASVVLIFLGYLSFRPKNQLPVPPTVTQQAATDTPLPAHNTPKVSPTDTPVPTSNTPKALPTDTNAPPPTLPVAPTQSTSSSIPPNGTNQWVSPSDGMVLIRIPVGSFRMGSNSSPWKFESPEHTVNLDEYWIDKFSVTNAMFSKFIEESKYVTAAEKNGGGYVSPGSGEVFTQGANWRHPTGPESDLNGKENYPVVQVTWNEAQAYCTWAGRRLLTEAEWEKAARGDDARLYPWGNNINCSHANYSDDNNSYCTGGITSVDAYPSGASPYGIMDMTGNTWDWVADWYQSDYYSVSPSNNPKGPASGDRRVHRGGAWYNFNLQVQVSYRYSNPPDWTFGSVGIRCGYSN